MLTIVSLVLGTIGAGAGILSLIKVKKIYDLFKKEDITVEEGNDIIIKNRTF